MIFLFDQQLIASYIPDVAVKAAEIFSPVLSDIRNIPADNMGRIRYEFKIPVKTTLTPMHGFYVSRRDRWSPHPGLFIPCLNKSDQPLQICLLLSDVNSMLRGSRNNKANKINFARKKKEITGVPKSASTRHLYGTGQNFTFLIGRK